MEHEITLTMEDGVARARNEAEKLADKIDNDNLANKRQPIAITGSREQFVKMMTSQLAKVLVHRTVLKL